MCDDLVKKSKILLEFDIDKKILRVLGKELSGKHTEFKVLIDGDSSFIESINFSELKIVVEMSE